MDSLVITRPDDWHLHLRDGEALTHTVPATSQAFERAIVMPNLVPPVTKADQAEAYRRRIMASVPAGQNFDPLMVLYLTDQTTPEDIDAAADSEHVVACKLYPAGATTNSDSGVTRLDALTPTLERMQERKVLLLIHGEVVDPHVDVFDREKQFIDNILLPLRSRLPDLRIVLEHITTSDAVQFVESAGENTAATLTAHHLMCNRNHMLVGGIRPHYYCLPILKRSSHQQALQDVVASGHRRFFLGTDSAPHPVGKKESACGCAGCYTAPYAMPLYAQIFEDLGAIEKLEAFSSLLGPAFYQMPANSGKIRLLRQETQIPDRLELGSDTIVPFLAGESLRWALDTTFSDGQEG